MIENDVPSKIVEISSTKWRGIMTEYGEWNRKGATLSDVTACKEYGYRRTYDRH